MAHVFLNSEELHKLTNIPNLPRKIFVGELRDSGDIFWTPTLEFIDKIITVTADFVNKQFKTKRHIVDLKKTS